MPRNLDNRVEAVAPVDEPELRARLDEILDQLLADEALSWELRSDGSWARLGRDREDPHDAQAALATLARERHGLS